MPRLFPPSTAHPLQFGRTAQVLFHPRIQAVGDMFGRTVQVLFRHRTRVVGGMFERTVQVLFRRRTQVVQVTS